MKQREPGSRAWLTVSLQCAFLLFLVGGSSFDGPFSFRSLVPNRRIISTYCSHPAFALVGLEEGVHGFGLGGDRETRFFCCCSKPLASGFMGGLQGESRVAATLMLGAGKRPESTVAFPCPIIMGRARYFFLMRIIWGARLERQKPGSTTCRWSVGIVVHNTGHLPLRSARRSTGLWDSRPPPGLVLGTFQVTLHTFQVTLQYVFRGIDFHREALSAVA
ncbi:hypothetical protein VTK73DRAFT_5268 [Phialemonium thermophilum]|uniref:Secreted protein n=1 Tax=Phialemonium thermophilum TaxID=223376 RepID=A0ABR3V2C0_9PEZI